MGMRRGAAAPGCRRPRKKTRPVNAGFAKAETQ